MSETIVSPVAVGNRAPAFIGIDQARGFFSPRALCGRPALLILVGARAAEQGKVMLGRLEGELTAFAARDTEITCLTEDNPARVLMPSPVARMVDSGDFRAHCGVGADDVLLLLLDREGRIVLAAGPEDTDIAGACLRCIDQMATLHRPEERPLLDALLAPLAIGEKLPPCFGMAQDRAFYSSEHQYGRPAVLALVGPRADPRVGAVALQAISMGGADVLLITVGNPARLAELAPPPIRVVDAGDFLARCGVAADEARVLVVDRNQRIALNLRLDAGMDVPTACLASLDALPREAPRAISTPAPALLLPNLLPPALCRHLITVFDTTPAMQGTVSREDATGRVGNVVDPSKKRRRDMLIEPGTDLHTALHQVLLRRCRPELQKAFQCRVDFLDRILVACYDAGAGWFRRHRDNEADTVAFREFALSLNLNTGEYQGGHLLFPEYNDHAHEPAAGAGVIFSTSVLHEAAPVTEGRRYVLLTFLHGEAAEARRLAWLAKTAEV